MWGPFPFSPFGGFFVLGGGGGGGGGIFGLAPTLTKIFAGAHSLDP